MKWKRSKRRQDRDVVERDRAFDEAVVDVELELDRLAVEHALPQLVVVVLADADLHQLRKLAPGDVRVAGGDQELAARAADLAQAALLGDRGLDLLDQLVGGLLGLGEDLFARVVLQAARRRPHPAFRVAIGPEAAEARNGCARPSSPGTAASCCSSRSSSGRSTPPSTCPIGTGRSTTRRTPTSGRTT